MHSKNVRDPNEIFKIIFKVFVQQRIINSFNTFSRFPDYLCAVVNT